jgi:phosphatidylinositol alpha-1,6-mannosyltransferase
LRFYNLHRTAKIINILVLAKAYPPEIGGIETYSEQVSLAYAAGGHTVTVLTTHPGTIGCVQRGTVRIHNVGQGRQIKVFFRMVIVLRKIFKSQSIELIHATSWKVAIPVYFLKLPPPVISVHGSEVFVVPAILKRLMIAVLRHSRALIVVSQPIMLAMERNLGIPPTLGIVGWNGVSFPEEANANDSSPNLRSIFCLCRLVERKNLENAIKAVASLSREGYKIKFSIAGTGPEADRLYALIQDSKLDCVVEMLGFISDKEVIKRYKEASIFLHPQISTRGGADLEGFGISIADAMSFGCAVIAGASGGPLDFIENEVTGLLVDGLDQQRIESALRFLLDDDVKRQKIATAAKTFAVREFTWISHVEKVLQTIEHK